MSATAATLEAEAEAAVCPICASHRSHELWNFAELERRVVTCDQCGFTYVWPRIEQDFSTVPESYYYDDWNALDPDAARGLYYDVIGAARRAGVMRSDRDAINARSVLEVGCGAGHALLNFQVNGWRVQGVDPWASVTAIGRKYYRLPLVSGRIETAEIEAGSHDLVLALDVLQFVAQPTLFLAACFRALKQGGLLYATVPNFGSSARKLAGRNWHYLLPCSYLSYFTPESVASLVQSAGFVRVETTVFGGPDDDAFVRILARRAMETTLTWDDIAEDVDDSDLPALDRANIDESRLTAEQQHWRQQGYLMLPNFIPDELIDRYCAVRERLSDPNGWNYETPYMVIPEIRDLCLYQPLMDMLEHLIGETMALSLNLTGWRSSQRSWHQDDYLNPPEVNGHYAAVWFALDRISPHSGPFEFVPGSHRWPLIRRSRILSLLDMDAGNRDWPWHSEQLLTPFFEREIARRNSTIERFLGNKGDVLIWHSRLAHCGSLAEHPEMERRAIISHYSGLSRCAGMPKTRRHPGAGYYFVSPSMDLNEPTPPVVPSNGLRSLLRKIVGY